MNSRDFPESGFFVFQLDILPVASIIEAAPVTRAGFFIDEVPYRCR